MCIAKVKLFKVPNEETNKAEPFFAAYNDSSFRHVIHKDNTYYNSSHLLLHWEYKNAKKTGIGKLQWHIFFLTRITTFGIFSLRKERNDYGC